MFEQPSVFPCPNCNRMISADAEKCRHCEAPIDREAASAAAALQDKASSAYSDANFLKTAAVLMWIFLGLSFIPFVPLVGWGFLAVFVALLVMLIRWQVRFGSLPTKDADYGKAKSFRNLAAVLWIVALLVGFVGKPLLFGLMQAGLK